MNLHGATQPVRAVPDEMVPSRYALTVGKIEVVVFSDGVLTPPAESMATNADPTVRGAWLDDMFLSRVEFDWALNEIVVRSGQQTILIDSGIGEQVPDFKRAGNLFHRLESARIELASVTDVVLTHMHFDHVGGLLLDGVKARLRPDLRIHVAASEIEFWKAPDFSRTGMPPALAEVARRAAGQFLREYQRFLRPFEEEHEVAPGVVVQRTGGHTPGHSIARDFAQAEFVDQGMIADLNVHWDIGEDGMPKPHAHVMLTMREVDEDGFGQKVREWNATQMVERWRERWAEHVNERLAELDIDAQIDHRSLEAQGIGLEPQSQIGASAQRIESEGIEAADRAELHREIARNNGARIIDDPSLALDAITQQQSTFTRRDMAMFAHRHSDGIEQFNEVMGAMRGSPDLVELGQDGRGEDRFTTRDMIEAEQRLHRAAEMMAEKERHEVSGRDREAALARAGQRGLVLSGEQADALAHVTDGRELGLVVGYAGTGKSAMLGVAREAWEAAGFEVRGVALSGIAAENLESGSGIASRTIASMEHGWKQGCDMLTSRDVLVIDEAGMVGTRQLERVLSHAAEAGAKVVLVGDPQQLQSIEAGAAFRSIHDRHGGDRRGSSPARGLAAGRHPRSGDRTNRRCDPCL
ncbi:hypothetical protein GCM10010994_43810 [Chelatococcus reniformis]|uniref:Metallo-beta-lactamase domain-containing protein n=1 Tax=Chelatococcus reniformis TaxID=1494448 RepID=A0A916UQ03_9HYPH|nr:hypothetical protein GCM10010994_43810 [Chelatococcus reniformis]